MIIIVEGIDGAGKTTLCQYLAKKLRAVYIKVERPRRAVDLMAYQNILEVADAYSGWVVTDRHVAISEPIYGPVCRGKHDLKQTDIDACYARMQVIIYCRPPDPAIYSAINRLAHMEGVLENAAALLHGYDNWWHELITPALQVRYDYTTQTVEGLVKQLLEHQDRRKQ